ncbi:hypothetical protein GX51_05439 [Blastomyces parvus]|uniref:Uncharacterized protein n=1 Tax=Blastomyces parvus TaxID=2060905 RepID=A0A2B7WX03_9EURO|nr:hypothetical protein GX51_05439 [Blastomyces parvus]
MCLWWGTPYKAYVIEDAPKKKKKDEEGENENGNVQFIMVNPGDQFVPVGASTVMAFFLAPVQQQQQQQQHPQPTVFRYIPMQNPAHPQHAALQAANPFPGHIVENHNPPPANNNGPAAPAPAVGPHIAPVTTAAAPNQAVMVAHGQIAVGQQPQQAFVAQPQAQNWFGWAPAAAVQQQQQPQAFFAPNPQQLHAQNVAAAQGNGANVPRQLVPYNPPAGQALWVHNLDGSWSLRTVTDIHNKLNGQWINGKQGYPYFQVQAKPGS